MDIYLPLYSVDVSINQAPANFRKEGGILGLVQIYDKYSLS